MSDPSNDPLAAALAENETLKTQLAQVRGEGPNGEPAMPLHINADTDLTGHWAHGDVTEVHTQHGTWAVENQRITHKIADTEGDPFPLAVADIPRTLDDDDSEGDGVAHQITADSTTGASDTATTTTTEGTPA